MINVKQEILLNFIEFQERAAFLLDEMELESWASLFSESGTYKITTRDNVVNGLDAGVVYCVGREMILDRISALRHANMYEPQRYRHILSFPQLNDMTQDQIYRVTTPFAIIRIQSGADMSVFACGVYRDQLELREEGIVIISREVICDSALFDTLLAIPL